MGIEQQRQARYGDLKLLGENLAPAELRPGDPVNVALYMIGIMGATFHLANGFWLLGINWGLTMGPRAQKIWGDTAATKIHPWRSADARPALQRVTHGFGSSALA